MIKTLEELRQPDDRTLRFTPMGLGLGVQLHPEDSAKFQQQVVAEFELDKRVTEGTRQSFEHLRTVYAYGVLCYEIYTLVADHALLVIEQALRDRFVDFHGGTVTFIDHNDADRAVAVSRYGDVHVFLKNHRLPRRNRWRIRLPDGSVEEFNSGMLADLRRWARRAGLLRGQRNRGIEQAQADLRNMVAHPSGYSLNGPVEAARTMRDLAEIINQLWGVPTPGGRLYPAPLRREVIVMAWTKDGQNMITGIAAEAFADYTDPEDREWECAILRAVFRPQERFSDPELRHYDSMVEVTHYPTDLLWGPGTITDAAIWFAKNTPQPDECDYLDRTFMVRHDGINLYLPMRSSIAATLAAPQRAGTWYVVKADHPNDAYQHVHNVIAGAGCADDGPCGQCHAESIGSGALDHALACTGRPETVNSASPSDFQTPWALARSRPIAG